MRGPICLLALLIAPPRASALASGGEPPPPSASRRAWLAAGGPVVSVPLPLLLLLPGGGTALASSPPPRVEEMGGAFDLRSPSPALRFPDALYPASAEGTWEVRRAVTAVEGDRGQAEIAWRCLGGGGGYGSTSGAEAFAGRASEAYSTRLIRPPSGDRRGYSYEFEGRTLTATVADRGYEMESRLGQVATNRKVEVEWRAEEPDRLGYGPVALAVVQRTVEPIGVGFGSSELYRATTPLGGLAPGAGLDRAVRVRRRFRRAFEADGTRVLEGLEIVTTYRVLDGIAGVEMPTSTTKSVLRLTQAAPPGKGGALS